MSIVSWQRSPDTLAAQVEEYGRRIQRAVLAVGDLIAARLQSYAQANAPWTDRTGNARQALTGVAQAAGDLVIVYLYHGMSYGKWLEIARGGPYRIIMPTIQAVLPEVWALIRSAIGGM